MALNSQKSMRISKHTKKILVAIFSHSYEGRDSTITVFRKEKLNGETSGGFRISQGVTFCGDDSTTRFSLDGSLDTNGTKTLMGTVTHRSSGLSQHKINQEARRHSEIQAILKKQNEKKLINQDRNEVLTINKAPQPRKVDLDSTQIDYASTQMEENSAAIVENSAAVVENSATFVQNSKFCLTEVSIENFSKVRELAIFIFGEREYQCISKNLENLFYYHVLIGNCLYQLKIFKILADSSTLILCFFTLFITAFYTKETHQKLKVEQISTSKISKFKLFIVLLLPTVFFSRYRLKIASLILNTSKEALVGAVLFYHSKARKAFKVVTFVLLLPFLSRMTAFVFGSFVEKLSQNYSIFLPLYELPNPISAFLAFVLLQSLNGFVCNLLVDLLTEVCILFIKKLIHFFRVIYKVTRPIVRFLLRLAFFLVAWIVEILKTAYWSVFVL